MKIKYAIRSLVGWGLPHQLRLGGISMCLAREKPSPKPSALRLPPNKINKKCVAASSAGLQQSGVQTWGWPFK
ncbi:MAG: hypothetical protein WAV28_01195, partial [Sedimentisphaerales bacterium]